MVDLGLIDAADVLFVQDCSNQGASNFEVDLAGVPGSEVVIFVAGTAVPGFSGGRSASPRAHFLLDLQVASRSVYKWRRSTSAEEVLPLTYNVYCGRELIDTDEDGVADDYGQCVFSDLVETEADLFTTPDPLKKFYYIVAAKNLSGEGSWAAAVLGRGKLYSREVQS